MARSYMDIPLPRDTVFTIAELIGPYENKKEYLTKISFVRRKARHVGYRNRPIGDKGPPVTVWANNGRRYLESRFY